jgi:tetratricopeptide (TPR) repeat protein
VSETTHKVIVFLALGGALGWLMVHTIKRAEDPARMVFKWILTIIVMCLMYWQAFPLAGKGGMVAFTGVSYAMIYAIVLAITWRHNLGGLIAKPFASLYDGGDLQIEPRPMYSIAQSRQKQGRYLEAVTEIRKQLDRFPTDFEGHMMLAQIQAENLQDLPGAELTIQRLCSQPGHAARNIAFALYSLTDWYLKIGQDIEGARRALEQIPRLLPDTEFALTAAQRIAHLGAPEMLLDPHDRKKFVVAEGPRNLGLARNPARLAPSEKSPTDLALEYVHHLEQHPLDTEAREKLAGIYADHYARLDLALDQLEQMIQLPNQPHRQVVRWLNQYADLQIRSGSAYEAVKPTLQRIVDLDPNVAAAEIARKRIDLLKLELKAKQPKEAVKMGTYEQNIGLKQRPPVT